MMRGGRVPASGVRIGNGPDQSSRRGKLSAACRAAARLQQKGRSPKRAPLLMRLWQKQQGYIFFSEHTFFAASHVPPAFSQSAAFFAVVTSPAKAGPVKASAKASANVETSVFMDVTPYGCRGCQENSVPTPLVPCTVICPCAALLDIHFSRNLDRHSLVSVPERSSGRIATMSHLFAAILLFSSPGCPHEEATCITPTEYVEINLSTRILPYVVAPPVNSDCLRSRARS